jgi:hypothetical protein
MMKVQGKPDAVDIDLLRNFFNPDTDLQYVRRPGEHFDPVASQPGAAQGLLRQSTVADDPPEIQAERWIFAY